MRRYFASAAAKFSTAFPNLPVAVFTLFRVRLGLLICWAGLTKCLPLPAPTFFVQMVSDLGFTFPSPLFWAVLAIWGEILGGLLLAVGLWTRWAAIQLTIQFAVISFLWYNEPEFFTGLYLQQEMFWALVLLISLGGSHWSVDAWRAGRRSAQSLSLAPRLGGRPAAAAVAGLLVLLSLPVAGQAPCSLDLVILGQWRLHLVTGAQRWAAAPSVTLIEPGQQFVLGGGQRGSFQVRGTNVGAENVRVVERFAIGDTVGRAVLRPADVLNLPFRAGSAALIVNPSRTTIARLNLRISGADDALGMTYEATHK